jgi:hypothetical protein
MTTPMFVEMSIVGLRSPRLVNVSDIRSVGRTPDNQHVDVEIRGIDGEGLLELVEGSYEDWCERLGVRRASEVDGQELAAAASRYEQEARA